MRNLIVFVCFFVLGLAAQGQIQQLEDSLSTATGLEKTDLLNRLSELWLGKAPAKSLNYAQQSLKLAKELKDPSAILSGHIN